MYELQYSKRFKKDLKRLKKSGRFDFSRLAYVIDCLVKGERLPKRYRDHALKGDLAKMRECHIMPDLLLVYEKVESTMVLQMIRIGSHSELF